VRGTAKNSGWETRLNSAGGVAVVVSELELELFVHRREMRCEHSPAASPYRDHVREGCLFPPMYSPRGPMQPALTTSSHLEYHYHVSHVSHAACPTMAALAAPVDQDFTRRLPKIEVESVSYLLSPPSRALTFDSSMPTSRAASVAPASTTSGS
jgi:hypothetical protein